MGRKNLNSLERIQREKVGVTRNNVRRAPAHREFQELIVFRITASRNSYINLNPFRLERQSRQKASNIFFVYISKKFFPPEDLIDFCERRKREQDSSLLDSQFKRMTRFRIGQE